MNYTYYDYLELAPGAPTGRIEAAYMQLVERFQYGITDARQDLSGLVRMIHAAHEVLSNADTRRAYDAKLAREAAAADQELKAELDAMPALPYRKVQEIPASLYAAYSAMAA